MDSQLLFGESVRVFEQAGGWAWVQATADGYVGYLKAACLGPAGNEPTHRVASGQTVVLSDEQQVAAPIHTLSLGARVSVVEEGERFHRLASGGYVFAEHLCPVASVEQDWVSVAERLLGLPYLWGGRGHGGIDCSGLVQLALESCSIPCLRDSDQQAQSVGQPIGHSPPAWQRGDLVYVPGHVLIVRDADTVIHATGFRWAVIVEPTQQALARLSLRGFDVSAVRRPA
jgi:cell wall-associated NlpC family hydrolase